MLAVAHAVAAFADWELLTSRPTWAVLCDRTGLSRRTVARWLSWLHTAGLLATVAHGTTSDFSPGILRAQPGEVVCEAAVYVLIRRAPLRIVDGGQVNDDDSPSPVDETGTPSWSPKGTSPARARGDLRNREESRRERSVELWPAGQRPATKNERHLAAAEAQRRNPLLRKISTAYVAALFREAHLAGWTLVDVLRAVDNQPDGSPWLHTAEIRHVPGLIRHRLAAWRNDTGDGSGPFLSSPSQRARTERARLQALARARATAYAERRAASTPSVEASRWADRVRAELRAARERRQG
jgi:hypothetical protein